MEGMQAVKAQSLVWICVSHLVKCIFHSKVSLDTIPSIPRTHLYVPETMLLEDLILSSCSQPCCTFKDVLGASRCA
jgi:hypothetical protein